MPIEISGDLLANVVEINEHFLAKSDRKILIYGSGSVIRINTDRPARMVWIDANSNSEFFMDSGVWVGEMNSYIREKSSISLGANTYAVSKINLFCHEHSRITIGQDCLFGDLFECMTSDMHSVLDATTGKRLNPPDNVVIGDKVWCGARVTILKNTIIGSGSVVGIGSYVNGTFPENCMIKGQPAQILKRNVTWHPELLPW